MDVNERINNWHEQGLLSGAGDRKIELQKTMLRFVPDLKVIFSRGTPMAERVKLGIDAAILMEEGTPYWKKEYGDKIRRDAISLTGTRVPGTLMVRGYRDLYDKMKAAFWEGFIEGRKAVGVDIRRLLTAELGGLKRKRGKRARSKVRSMSAAGIRGVRA